MEQWSVRGTVMMDDKGVIITLSKIEKKIKGFADSTSHSFKNVQKILSGISSGLGLGPLGSISAIGYTIAKITRQALEFAATIDEISKKFNVQRERVHALANVFAYRGVNWEAPVEALDKVTEFTERARDNANGLESAMLKALQIDTEKFFSMDVVDRFMTLGKQLALIKDSNMQNAYAMQIFGQKSADVITIFRELGEGVDNVLGEEFNKVFDENLSKANAKVKALLHGAREDMLVAIDYYLEAWEKSGLSEFFGKLLGTEIKGPELTEKRLAFIQKQKEERARKFNEELKRASEIVEQTRLKEQLAKEEAERREKLEKEIESTQERINKVRENIEEIGMSDEDILKRRKNHLADIEAKMKNIDSIMQSTWMTESDRLQLEKYKLEYQEEYEKTLQDIKKMETSIKREFKPFGYSESPLVKIGGFSSLQSLFMRNAEDNYLRQSLNYMMNTADNTYRIYNELRRGSSIIR